MTRAASSSRRLVRRLAGPLVLSVLALSMAGCSMFSKKGEEMACPVIRVDRDTAKLTQFQPGAGKDITDITLEGGIAAVNGDCGWDPKTRTIDVKLKVLFDVTRGPALQGKDASFQYFVAIPAFYPSPDAKQIYPLSVTFPDGNVNTMKVRDEEVRITLPLGEKGNSKDYPVYVGFQLTPKELDYNRKSH